MFTEKASCGSMTPCLSNPIQLCKGNLIQILSQRAKWMRNGYHLTDPSRVTSLHCTLQVLTGAGTKFCFTFVQEESSDWTSMWQMVPNRTSDHLSQPCQPIPRIAEASNPCAANISTPPNNKYFFIHHSYILIHHFAFRLRTTWVQIKSSDIGHLETYILSYLHCPTV